MPPDPHPRCKRGAYPKHPACLGAEQRNPHTPTCWGDTTHPSPDQRCRHRALYTVTCPLQEECAADSCQLPWAGNTWASSCPSTRGLGWGKGPVSPSPVHLAQVPSPQPGAITASARGGHPKPSCCRETPGQGQTQGGVQPPHCCPRVEEPDPAAQPPGCRAGLGGCHPQACRAVSRDVCSARQENK